MIVRQCKQPVNKKKAQHKLSEWERVNWMGGGNLDGAVLCILFTVWFSFRSSSNTYGRIYAAAAVVAFLYLDFVFVSVFCYSTVFDSCFVLFVCFFRLVFWFNHIFYRVTAMILALFIFKIAKRVPDSFTFSFIVSLSLCHF